MLDLKCHCADLSAMVYTSYSLFAYSTGTPFKFIFLIIIN